MNQPDRPGGAARVAELLRELALVVVRDSPQHELSRTAASTLSRLQRMGPQRITALADQEVVSQPSMTGLVQRLEALGYLSRTADPGDRRASLVAITPDGARAVGVRRRAHERAIARRLERLDADDLAALDSALPALTRLIDPDIATDTHIDHQTPETHVLA